LKSSGITSTTAISSQFNSDDQDIIDIVKQDHRQVEQLFNQWKQLRTFSGLKDEEEANKIFNQMIWELSRHSVAEELILYPALEELGGRGKELSEASREDHRKLKVTLSELQGMKNNEEFFLAMDRMFADLSDHIRMEESEDLPYFSANVDRDKRVAAAKAFNLKKKIAPTRPHPGIPDRPWALENALGLLTAPIDKLRDMFTPFPDDKKAKASVSSASSGHHPLPVVKPTVEETMKAV
jgi:hemerythrin superfamily protein